jgi:hypothetical protein
MLLDGAPLLNSEYNPYPSQRHNNKNEVLTTATKRDDSDDSRVTTTITTAMGLRHIDAASATHSLQPCTA